jgi:transcription initiation factor TFIIB
MAVIRDAAEANLLYVASEIERMGEELELPTEVTEFGLQLYVQAVKSGYRPSTIDRATATCLYFSARFRDAPVTIDDIANMSRRKAKNIYHESSTLSDAIGMQIEPDDPADFVEEFTSELDWSEDAIERAEDLCEIAKEEHVHSGRSPSGIAAAVLYARSELDDLGYTQGEIAEVADTTTVTIRNSYPEIMQHAPDVEPEDLASRDFDVAFQVIEDNVDLPDYVCEMARERARSIDDAEVARGQSKAGIASAAYLVVAREDGIDLERTRLAEITGISPQTVSKYTGVV